MKKRITGGGDYDIWRHMKLGELHVENLTLAINHSQFSWTNLLRNLFL